MNWEKAIEQYALHKSRMAKTKSPASVKQSVIANIKYLLEKIPELASKSIQEIDSDIWREALRNHISREKELERWSDIGDESKGYKGKYKDLVRCLVLAKNGFSCRYCGRSLSHNPSCSYN